MNYDFFFDNIVDSLSTLKLNQQISKLLLLPLIFVGCHHQVKFQALQWHMQLHQVIQSHGPHKHHLTFCHYKLFLLLNILPSMLFPSLNVLLSCVVPIVQNYQMLLPKCYLDLLSSHTSMFYHCVGLLLLEALPSCTSTPSVVLDYYCWMLLLRCCFDVLPLRPSHIWYASQI